MKRLLLALALVVATPAHAEPATCEQMAGLIEDIATARQTGVPLSTVLNATADAPHLKNLILAIYEGQRYYSREAQRREAEEWRNRYHVACVRKRGE